MNDERVTEVISLFVRAPHSAPVRVTRKVLHSLLLDHAKIIAKGFARSWEFEHIGVGVYDVSLVPLERWQEKEE